MATAYPIGSEHELAPPGSTIDHQEADPASSSVLIIDPGGVKHSILQTLLSVDRYRVIIENRVGEALQALDLSPVDVVIVAASLPGDSLGDLCGALRANRRMQLTPVLVLSDVYSVDREIDCMAAGADSFLGGPMHADLLRARVRSMLRQKAIADRMEESETILVSLAQAVEHRDHATAGHCDRLAALSVAMGMAMDVPSQDLLALHRGGYLHDIGKIGIPDAILFKQGRLNEEEWRVMRSHTIKGVEICRPMKCLRPVLPIIRSHHERWDGSGYPDGLKQHDIPLLARILQIVDIYDALTSARSYKPALVSSDALRIMQEETDRGWHDPDVMRFFARFRHEEIRRAASDYGARWQDVEVMKESLKNLNAALLRA